MAEEVDPIASNFNNLFSSNLFKENNFIKLYNILLNNNTTTSTITINDSTSIITINYTVENVDKIAKIDYTKFVGFVGFDDIKSYFNDKVKKKEIIESILNKAIQAELSNNDIIVDPAGLEFMKGKQPLLIYNKTKKKFSGASGVSGSLYKYIINITTGDTIYNRLETDQNIKAYYNIENQDELFDIKFRNAKYMQYNIIYDNKLNLEKLTTNKLNLIHAVGYDYRGKSQSDNKDFDFSIEIPKFLKLYKDIYNEYEEPIKKLKGNYNLRLPCHSTGLFAGKYKYEILICIAFAYLDIYVKFKNNIPDTTKKINIYYLSSNENITFLKDIIEKLIDVISNKKS